MRRRWLVVFLAIAAVGATVLFVIMDRNEPKDDARPPPPGGEEDETQRRLGMLIAELHRIRQSGSFVASTLADRRRLDRIPSLSARR
jgi:hypothetical protein